MKTINTCPNHPFVVWGSCFLWLISMFAIMWSLLLFFFQSSIGRNQEDCLCVVGTMRAPVMFSWMYCFFTGVGDILLLTGTDIVNAIVLLSGIIMLPTNVHILSSIANGRKIDHKSKVVCCPLWLCIVWIIIISTLGAVCCIHKIYISKHATATIMNKTIKQYRSIPKYKHFVDNLQWTLKCCGFISYKDWFDHDWYDKIRDYEWDPNMHNKQNGFKRRDIKTVTDSVPLSCCKSGSCISNYLLELGTRSINTKGCGNLINRIIISSMIAHLVTFLSVVVVEIVILNLIMKQGKKDKHYEKRMRNNLNIRHIMSVNDKFGASSASLPLNPDDTDFENEVSLADVRKETSRKTIVNRAKFDNEDSESPDLKNTKKWEDDY